MYFVLVMNHIKPSLKLIILFFVSEKSFKSFQVKQISSLLYGEILRK